MPHGRPSHRAQIGAAAPQNSSLAPWGFVMLVSLRFIAVALIFALAIGCGSDGAVEDEGLPRADSPTADEIADLQFMREEEKLARDVYLVLDGEWGIQVFANVASSEQTHTDAVARTIERLELEDPVVDDTIGVFVNLQLDALYDQMVTEGLQSSVDALHVGACGSRNHLRAFTSNLENAGHPYVAQFLDPTEVEAIISSPRETCGTP
jgi:hypothetical protein